MLSSFLTADPLLALGFGAPWLLWGLVGVAIPWLLHLLTKRQFKQTEWAAMKFLLDALRKNSRRIRLEHLLLLIVRTLLIALVVGALARPLWSGLTLTSIGTAPVHRILVFDASYSLGYEKNNQTAFESARKIARQILEQARTGDAWNLVRLAESEPRVIVSQPSYRADEVLTELERLKPSAEPAVLWPVLQSAEQLLKQHPEPTRKEIILITDLQKETWSKDTATDAQIRAALQRLSHQAQLMIYDVGTDNADNLAVTDLKLTESLVTSHAEARIQATVRAYGKETPPPQTLELWVDGQLQGQQPVTLAPQQEVNVPFTHRFTQGGWKRIRVQLGNDRLPIDNQRLLAVKVRPKLRVLCVNGRPTGDPREAATFHVELALAPPSRENNPDSLVEPQVISAAELRNYELAPYDCIFLCNVSEFESSEVEQLRGFLDRGGVVVWSLGDRVQPTNYNKLLASPEAFLLPAPLAEREGDAIRKSPVRTIDPLDYAHPIVKIFQGNPAAGLATSPIYEYFRVGEVPANIGAPRIVLALDNGAPLILERQVGVGYSYLITTSLDESWGNWSVWPSFLPLIQELVLHGVSAAQPTPGVLVNRDLILSRTAEKEIQIQRPDNRTDSVSPQKASAATPVVYDKTDLPGFYSVASPGQEEQLVAAVNVDAREGDLAKFSKADLTQGILAGTPFEYATEFRGLSRPVSQDEKGTVEPARWLLFLALYLLFVEQMLAWNFRYGLCFLFPPAIPFLWRSLRP